LIQSHSYRLQFTVHDGDQTRTGGDVGQACIQLTAQCDPGFTGANCDQCDRNPLPSNGLYTWYCIPTAPGTAQPYVLRKIPKSEESNPAFAGGFVPDAGYFDPLGYAVTCNCTRTIVPCPTNCCGNGNCYLQNGTCYGCSTGWTGPQCCTPVVAPPPSNVTNVTNSTVPSPSTNPCYNNGSYCNRGRCVNSTCNCSDIPPQPDGTTFSGQACEIANVPPQAPPPACNNVGANNCSKCMDLAFAFGLNCEWCPTVATSATFLTNGTCVSQGTCGAGAQYTCVPPVVYTIPPCPDQCSGNGVCQNVTTTSNSQNSQANQATTTGSNTNATNTTVVQLCVCFNGFSGVNCAIGTTSDLTGVLAGSLGTAAIVGICVAIAICVGAAGGGGYAYAQGQGGGGLGNVNNNPLFQGNVHHGVNPLHQH